MVKFEQIGLIFINKNNLEEKLAYQNECTSAGDGAKEPCQVNN